MRTMSGAHAKTGTMQCCPASFVRLVRVVSAGLLGILTTLGLNGAVLGAGTCIERPNAGGYWSYRVDRANHRTCWYMTEGGLKTHEGASSGPAPSQTPTPNSILFSWFNSLRAGPPGSGLAGDQSGIARELHVPPTAPREAVKIVHAAPKLRPRANRRSAATAERNQLSPSRTSAEHTERIQPPDQATRDALFLEFLRWKELQKDAR
jgi:hypothetical protein